MFKSPSVDVMTAGAPRKWVQSHLGTSTKVSFVVEINVKIAALMSS